jgi:acyl-CoA dehydrogenase
MAATEKPVLDFDGLRPVSPFLTAEPEAWRTRVRAFVDAEIAPNLKDWDLARPSPMRFIPAHANADSL